jgi:hypothetical protein
LWRFNRSAVADTSIYDVIGPPWFLEVQLSVTGVQTDEEAGVQTVLGTDEYGQVKLIVSVSQGPSAATHQVPVSLSYAGLQRWMPLGSSVRQATLIAGGSVTGWTVSKTSGGTITQHALALQFGQQEICGGGGQRSRFGVAPRVVLNEQTANDFVAGDYNIRVTILPVNETGGPYQADLSLMPPSVLCQTEDFGVGVAIGLYPEQIYVTVPNSWSSTQPVWCGDSVLTMRARGGFDNSFRDCSDGWGPLFYYRRGILIAGGGVGTAAFWPGRTLLWRLEHGAYRHSFTGVGPNNQAGDWTYSLNGSENDLLYERAIVGDCPAGTSFFEDTGAPPLSDPCVGPDPLFSVSVEASVSWSVIDGTCDDYEAEPLQESFSFSVAMIRRGFQIKNGKRVLAFSGGGLQFGRSGFIDCGGGSNLQNSGPNVSVLVYASAPVPCGDQGNLELTHEVELQLGWTGDATRVYVVKTFPNGSGRQPEVVDYLPAPSGSITSTNINGTVPYYSRKRFICSDWDSATVPKQGIVLNRTCQDADGQPIAPGAILNADVSLFNEHLIGEQVVSRTINVAGSPLAVSRTLFFDRYGDTQVFTGTSSVLQDNSCDISTLLVLLPSYFQPGTSYGAQYSQYFITTRFVVGQCQKFSVIFTKGAVTQFVRGGVACDQIPQLTTVPCDGCEVDVTVLSGSELASVTITDGLVSVIAKETWISGDQMEIMVTCGAFSVTRTLRRSTVGSPTFPL